MTADLVTENFFAPANVGELDNPDGSAAVASEACGAVLRVFLLVDEHQRITDVKFKVAGCSYLVASCSLLSKALVSKTTGEAAVLCQADESNQTMVGECSIAKADCWKLASRGFVSAIRNYSDAVRDEWSGDEALICTCFGVSERTIEDAIKAKGLRSITEVTKASNAGAGCQSCFPLIEDILDQCSREESFDSLS